MQYERLEPADRSTRIDNGKDQTEKNAAKPTSFDEKQSKELLDLLPQTFDANEKDDIAKSLDALQEPGNANLESLFAVLVQFAKMFTKKLQLRSQAALNDTSGDNEGKNSVTATKGNTKESSAKSASDLRFMITLKKFDLIGGRAPLMLQDEIWREYHESQLTSEQYIAKLDQEYLQALMAIDNAPGETQNTLQFDREIEKVAKLEKKLDFAKSILQDVQYDYVVQMDKFRKVTVKTLEENRTLSNEDKERCEVLVRFLNDMEFSPNSKPPEIQFTSPTFDTITKNADQFSETNFSGRKITTVGTVGERVLLKIEGINSFYLFKEPNGVYTLLDSNGQKSLVSALFAVKKK